MLMAGFNTGALRKYDIGRVLSLAQQTQMQAIEWAEQPHAPASLGTKAQELRERAADAGLEPVLYGSYYRLNEPSDSPPLEQVLDTAAALGTPTVRVWAGKTYGGEIRESYWNAVAREGRRAAEAAAERGLQLAIEFHQNSLNNTEEHWDRLRESIEHPAVKTMWQPLPDEETEKAHGRLKHFIPHLAHIHVYHWEHGVRMAFDRGWQAWLRYVRAFENVSSRHALILQMVEGDTFEHFLRDADTVVKLSNIKLG